MKNYAIACIGAFAIALAGCGQSSDDGLSKKDQEAGTRIEQIAKESGGDWEKISEADRKYLVEVSMGSEQSAKMLIYSKSGKLQGTPGGTPKPKP
jgi:hypothetical protein